MITYRKITECTFDVIPACPEDLSFSIMKLYDFPGWASDMPEQAGIKAKD
jgi:hypothetical protein